MRQMRHCNLKFINFMFIFMFIAHPKKIALTDAIREDMAEFGKIRYVEYLFG